MNQTITADASLLSATHPQISKHTNLFSVILSSLVGVAGIASLLVALDMDKSSSVSMGLMTLGTILLLVALYRIFWRSKERVYLPTGSTVTEGSCYLDICDLQAMNDALEHGGFDVSYHVGTKISGNARMDYMVSKDKKFAAAQLFRFIPYTYEPASRIYYFADEEAAAFVHRLNEKSF